MVLSFVIEMNVTIYVHRLFYEFLCIYVDHPSRKVVYLHVCLRQDFEPLCHGFEIGLDLEIVIDLLLAVVL